jgi:hypothetical protein
MLQLGFVKKKIDLCKKKKQCVAGGLLDYGNAEGAGLVTLAYGLDLSP